MKKVEFMEANVEIRNSMMEFGEDVLITKFPSYIDGLKDITRRIIWFTRNFTEKKNFIAAKGIVAENHVGGDQAIYEAMIRLGQPFMVGHPAIKVYGKVGNYYAPSDSAADRYLNLSVSEFTQDVFFRNINLNAIPMKYTKTYSGKEPKYLIPKIPTALIFGNLTVGVGYKSYTPMVDIQDVCKLVMILAEYYDKGGFDIPPMRKMVNHLIPSWPINTLIRNKEELINAYMDGDFTCPISMEGYADISGNRIDLRSIPPGTDFGKMVNDVRVAMATDKKYLLNDYLNTASQFSSDEAEFSLEIKRGLNPFEVFEKIKPKLSFNDTFRPIYHYINDRNRVVCLTPISILTRWYTERSQCIARGLEYKINDLVKQKMEYEAMLRIIDHTQDIIAIIQSTKDEEDAVDILTGKYDTLTPSQARIIYNCKLSVLSHTNKDQLLNKLKYTHIEIENTNDAFFKIHETIYNDAQTIMKKYGATTKTRYSTDFKGYVKFGDQGIVNFFNEDDMISIFNSQRWPMNMNKTIHLYDPKCKDIRYLLNGRLIPVTEMPRTLWCNELYQFPTSKTNYSLCIDREGSTCVLEKAVIDIGDRTICPITPKFYGIHRNGLVTEDNIKDYSIRKSISKGSKTDLIYGLPWSSKNMVVIHANDSDVNTVRFDLIITDKGLKRVSAVPTGNMYIIGVYPLDTTDFYINIPLSCIRGTSLSIIHIDNLKDMFKKDDTYVLSIARSTLRRDKNIKNMAHLGGK